MKNDFNKNSQNYESENTFFVDVDWVKQQIDNKRENMVILDMPYGQNEYVKNADTAKRDYAEEHIPGTLLIDKTELESRDSDLNLYEAAVIEQIFLGKGVDKNTLLIVYADGIIASSRVALAAYWLGVDQVKIINGGIAAWKAAGYEVETGVNESEPKSVFGSQTPARPEILLSTPEDVIVAQEQNDNFVLANIRSWDEFTGKLSGYPYIEKAGAPKGSVYAKASTDRVNVSYLEDERGFIVDPKKKFEEWEDWGINEHKTVAFFCGAGWRAAAAFFLAKQSGWQNVAVYDGGWYLWDIYNQQNPDRYPIQVGNPKEQDIAL